MVGGCVDVALGLLDMATMGEHRALLPFSLVFWDWFTAVQMDAAR